jgi:hypothetical protein
MHKACCALLSFQESGLLPVWSRTSVLEWRDEHRYLPTLPAGSETAGFAILCIGYR